MTPEMSEESRKRMDHKSENYAGIHYDQFVGSIENGSWKQIRGAVEYGYQVGMSDPEANAALLEECEKVLELWILPSLRPGTTAESKSLLFLEKLRARKEQV